MRFFRKNQIQEEAPCPRCCIAVATDAQVCPECGYNFADPAANDDGWTPPVAHDTLTRQQ